MSRAVLFISVFTIFLDVLQASQATNGAEPQVAVLCEAGATYHPQYMSAAGRWTPDLTTKPHNCLKDKMEILDYCKKVYPSHDITNIVEASHYVKVSNWCKLGSSNAAKCKVTRWVKPFRCLEGPFQSDALLVPESCLFDHIHNQSRCWQFSRWNATAGRACAQRGLRLRTFAMLLPCGISLFSGVEFVCCPKHFKENVKMHKPMDVGVPVSPGGEEMLAASAAMDERDDELLDDEDSLTDEDDDTLNLNDDDDDDDTDDDMDEDEDADLSRDDDAEDDDYTDSDDSAWPRPESSASPSTTTSTTTTTTTTTTASTATSDPYFSHFDPRTEHQSYKDAQQRLEETHREKITKVMREWSELEDRYQQMMTSDPSTAQTFRQRMTAKFQANIQSLEEEGVSERRRLAALHQQRVLAHLAQRRRTALTCYTRSLRDTPPNAHRVQKCLQRLVRALAAERSGALAAWRRAAAAGREAAAAERASAADRLQDADRALQRALTSLRRRPHLYASIGTAIEDYVQSMQSKDDMAVSLMSMTPEAEELLLDRIEAEVQREQAAREQLNAKRDQRTRQRQDIQNERVRTSNGVKESEEADDEASEINETEDTTTVSTTQTSAAPSASPSPSASVSVHDLTTRSAFTQETTTTEIITSTMTDAPESETETSEVSETSSRRSTSETEGEGLRAALEQAEERAPPPPAHALKHELQHTQPGFTVRGASPNSSGSGALYPALCVGGAALAAAAAVALAVARRRDRAPSAQGFVQVEQTGAVAPTPEERHVANMQINGYENPTYKYFEVKE
ncbi:amyloid-beta-like protein isoform X2 [Vanessa tameamea]|uniref:Amyloid-beta-like protein isoform X2 n=1 Tax=Vanessa tameamea TaxID=334116 RepID=A0A8B8I9R4_VANTA|nr:amyloid-beta-like protein isoform X2 [Vanessa tameamea]XP_047533830.1 amyloid-beta-like protein isoform X1 [Vanessa atalanta]